MYDIEKKIIIIANRIKPNTNIVIPDDLAVPLIGKKFNFDEIDFCFLMLEVMTRFKLEISPEDLQNDDIFSIHGLSDLIRRHIDS